MLKPHGKNLKFLKLANGSTAQYLSLYGIETLTWTYQKLTPTFSRKWPQFLPLLHHQNTQTATNPFFFFFFFIHLDYTLGDNLKTGTVLFPALN